LRRPSSRTTLRSRGVAYAGYCYVCGFGPSRAACQVTRPRPELGGTLASHFLTVDHLLATFEAGWEALVGYQDSRESLMS
jgi:hypothetical protein